MLTVFLVLIIIGIVFLIIYFKDSDYFLAGMLVCSIFGLFVLIFDLIAIGFIANIKVQEQKIEMYQEENSKMETSIAGAIEKYLEHEYDIFVEISPPDETQTFLIAYPELQSSELVKYQLETIKTNNDQIKVLKNELLDVKIWKFLVYFG